jgi:hypothetical protein
MKLISAAWFLVFALVLMHLANGALHPVLYFPAR